MSLLTFCVILGVVVKTFGHGVPVFAPEETTAFNYFERIGIPEAERLRAAEEAFLNGNTNRIVGGAPTNKNEIPYQAGLIIEFEGNDGRRGVCGASLVSTTRLITAAHCWFDGTNQANLYTVILGSTLLFSGGTRVQTSNVVTHPDWNPSMIKNDAAVIKLNEAVALSDSIQPIALPSGAQLQEDYSGSQATVSGFGKTSDSGGISTDQFLSSVKVDVTPNIWCTIIYPGVFQNSNICTNGAGGKGPCGGDSGGPLVVPSDNGNILIGIVSFGSSAGCSRGLPSAFTRVTSFIDFIQENM